MRRRIVAVAVAVTIAAVALAVIGAVGRNAPVASATTSPIVAHHSFDCALRSPATRRFVSTELGFGGALRDVLRVRATTVGSWERFRCLAVGKSSWAIWSKAAGRYVASELGYPGGVAGVLRARSTSVGAWETFALMFVRPCACYALRAANARYVSAELGYPGWLYGLVRARSASAGSWEEFTIADLTASPPGGTTTTTRPPVSTDCMASPHVCGFPDETNTGVRPGTSMTLITSSSTFGNGWSCDNPCTYFRITRNLGDATHGYELADGLCAEVDAPNLTVTNFKVDGCHGADSAAITVPVGSDNFTVTYCDLIGAPDSTADVSSPLRAENGGVLAINGQSGITVDHCHMHGFGTGGGVYLEAQLGKVVITNNFVDHENCWDSTNDISCPQSDSLYGSAYTDHTNAFHSGGGPGAGTTSSLLIRNNTLENDYTECCQTTALSLFNDSGPTQTQTNLHGLIDHNLIAAAGGFCTELQDTNLGQYRVTYLTVRNNHYSRQYGPNCGSAGIDFNGVSLNGWGAGDAQCGNVWDDGPFAGSGADQANTYPTKMQPVTSGC